MKQLLFFFILLSISTQSQNFSKVDNLVAKYPKFSKVEDLAAKISRDFTSDEHRARAAFYWIANNIRYDLKEYYNSKQRSYNFSYTTEEEKAQKLQALKDKIIDEAFVTKTGVCEEYAQAFKKVCDLLNIEAAVIKGNVRNIPQEIGKPENNTNHAWNTVKLNKKWILLDATWAAGFEYNGRWIKQFDTYFYNIPKDKIF
jgi:transglutaminase/protease-like cytokinesis protein 3